MSKKVVAMVVLLLALVAGCPEPFPISPNPPVITDTNMCRPACENLRRLGCPEGVPVFTGEECLAGMGCKLGTCTDAKCWITCERFCAETQDNGVWLNPTCVAGIESCSVIESCALVDGGA